MKKRSFIFSAVLVSLLSLLPAQEYLGNITIEMDGMSGNLISAFGSPDGYKSASRYLLSGTDLTMKFNYYVSYDGWLNWVKGDIGLWQSFTPQGFTAAAWWDPAGDIDTYTSGVRGYDTAQKKWSSGISLIMFQNRWTSTVYLNGSWENSVDFFPLDLKKKTGFSPYAAVTFNFIPNNDLKWEEQSYLKYATRFNKPKPEALTNYWNYIEAYAGVTYEKYFNLPNAPQSLYLEADARVAMENVYVIDNPVAVRIKYKLGFTIPRTTLTFTLHQELWMRYFNRPEAWQSNWIHRSGAIDLNFGLMLSYRFDFNR